MRRPEMLDQADAGDPVELPFDVAIILELELHPVRDAQFGGALVGKFDLVGRQRDAEHVDIVMAVQIEREPAPAAADVEHLHAGLQVQLGGDMRFLVELRLLEAVLGIAEIGAGILAVLVEEQLVEAAGEVVGMLGVAPRAAPPVDLVELAGEEIGDARDRALGLQPAGILERGVVAEEQSEVAHVAGRLDHEPAVHIGLAGPDARVLGDVPGGLAVGQADSDRAVIGIGRAVAIFLAVMVDDDQLTLLDELAEHLVEKPHGAALYGRNDRYQEGKER